MVSSRSLVKRYVFDLDGTLFDTRPLVERAYHRVGVVMPDGVWGQPASQWLPNVAGRWWKIVHEKKNIEYQRLLRESPPARTTAASAMIELALSGVEAYVITGASHDAAHMLLAGFQPYHYRLIGTSCDRSMKITKIKMLGRPSECVYVDDDLDTCVFMSDHEYSVVRYHLDMTKREVLEQWERSSSRPDAASA